MCQETGPRHAHDSGGSLCPHQAAEAAATSQRYLCQGAMCMRLTLRPLRAAGSMPPHATQPHRHLKLEGRGTRAIAINGEQCAPCHLPNINTTAYAGLQAAGRRPENAVLGRMVMPTSWSATNAAAFGTPTASPTRLWAPRPADDPTPWLCPACGQRCYKT
jgi:hypothetical protein